VAEQQEDRMGIPGWLEPAVPPSPSPPAHGQQRNGQPPAVYQAVPAAETASGPHPVPPPGAGYPPRGAQPGPSPSPHQPPPNEAPTQQGPPHHGQQQAPHPRGAAQQQRPPGQGYSYAPPPAPAHRAERRPGAEQALSVQDLSSADLLRPSKSIPRSGWRKAVYLASGRTVNLGESEADVQRSELIGRINQPLHGCYKIAMLSLKGGVGKTTTTVTLGSTFASLRGDRVVAVDANPDRGTLSQKIPLETAATVRHLLRDAHRITRYSDVRAYTSQGPSRLEVLASDSDPAVSEAFSEEDYRRTVDLLEHFYNIVLTDCGTGLMHSAMKGVLDVADSLVLVSSGSLDGARSASATLDWLDMHGYHELVKRSVAVINGVRPGSGKVDISRLAEHFAARCRAVHVLPFDPHLEEGAEVELERLKPATRSAMLDLAATIADDFPALMSRRPQLRP